MLIEAHWGQESHCQCSLCEGCVLKNTPWLPSSSSKNSEYKRRHVCKMGKCKSDNVSVMSRTTSIIRLYCKDWERGKRGVDDIHVLAMCGGVVSYANSEGEDHIFQILKLVL